MIHYHFVYDIDN